MSSIVSRNPPLPDRPARRRTSSGCRSGSGHRSTCRGARTYVACGEHQRKPRRRLLGEVGVERARCAERAEGHTGATSQDSTGVGGPPGEGRSALTDPARPGSRMWREGRCGRLRLSAEWPQDSGGSRSRTARPAHARFRLPRSGDGAAVPNLPSPNPTRASPGAARHRSGCPAGAPAPSRLTARFPGGNVKRAAHRAALSVKPRAARGPPCESMRRARAT